MSPASPNLPLRMTLPMATAPGTGVPSTVCDAMGASWPVSCCASLPLLVLRLLPALTCTPMMLPRGPPSERGAPLPGILLAAAGAPLCAVRPPKDIAVTSTPVVWLALCLRSAVGWVLRRIARSGWLVLRPLTGSFIVFVPLVPMELASVIALVSACFVVDPVLFPP